jgi:amino acid transporter
MESESERIGAGPPDSAATPQTDADTAAAAGTTSSDKGLKKGAIGFVDGLAIGLDSTAPAYSLAAVIGSIVVVVGLQAPGVLLLSFVPMFFIAAAFYYMNKAVQDCGTSFAWVTRALGPWWGWLGGWAICTTGILVVGSLADVAAFYMFDLVGLDGLRDTRVAVVALSVVLIVAMTTICVIGTEVSARLQRVLVFFQVGALILLVAVAFVEWILGALPAQAVDPQLSWLNPFADTAYSDLLSGMLIAVFIYWGWESALNLSEETEDAASAPGLAGLSSTVILLVTYVFVGVTVLAVGGPNEVDNFSNNPGVLGAIADHVLGPLAFVVTLAIIVSGLASAQTTIIPSSRTSLSMAHAGALPRAFARIHPSFRTPGFSTIAVGIIATAWYIGGSIASESFLTDSLSALSLMIAFYYALTGIACVIYWRHHIRDSVRNFLFIGVAPLLGAAGLGYLLVESAIQLSSPGESSTGTAVLGVGMPLVIGIGFSLVGVVIMFAWWAFGNRSFFSRPGFEAVPAEIAEGRATTAELPPL